MLSTEKCLSPVAREELVRSTAAPVLPSCSNALLCVNRLFCCTTGHHSSIDAARQGLAAGALPSLSSFFLSRPLIFCRLRRLFKLPQILSHPTKNLPSTDRIVLKEGQLGRLADTHIRRDALMHYEQHVSQDFFTASTDVACADHKNNFSGSFHNQSRRIAKKYS